MNPFRQVVKQVLSACVPPQWLLTRGPQRSLAERPRLALTFDDGPHPEHTEKLLDLLQKYDLRATFFVVGQQAVQYPKLVRRIVNEGHELANHTWSHSEPSQTTPIAFVSEIVRTDSLLLDLTGTIPRAVRPPKGELNLSKLCGLWRQQKMVALWNIDPRDYRMTSVDDAAQWAAAYQPQDGDVLLFHDNHPWAAAAIEQLASRGVFNQHQAVTVSTLVGLPAPRFKSVAVPVGT